MKQVGINPFAATAFTNAVAYPYSKLDFIASILEEHASAKAVDLLLDNIATVEKLNRYPETLHIFNLHLIGIHI